MNKLKVICLINLIIVLIFIRLNEAAKKRSSSNNGENNGHNRQLKLKHRNGDYYDLDNNYKSGNQNTRRAQRQKNSNKHVPRPLNDMSETKSKVLGNYPQLFNVALKAKAFTNATCGENGHEEYCKMIDLNTNRLLSSRQQHCGICDSNSPDPEKRHFVDYILENTNRWWQSPSLHYGGKYEKVSIVLDLGQLYQIEFVKIKSAISPRPASWVLERSIDGVSYEPWQYFGTSDSDCLLKYNLPSNNGKYVFKHDREVICSTQFSKIDPLENGEIHVSLINGRPGANYLSNDLIEFTLARFIRIRLDGMHGMAQSENNVRRMIVSHTFDKKNFYSIRLVKIGGRCFCSGHADKCKNINNFDKDMLPECKCQHNTCGRHCEMCCPMYNQFAYKQGTSDENNECQLCNCHGHAVECLYDSEIAVRRLSLDMHGDRKGGGVCLNCTKFTTGINCDSCLPNYYRPFGIPADFEIPCIKCDCNPVGTKAPCDPLGGTCQCKEGFTGEKCNYCEPGYRGEGCTKCMCDIRGTMPGGECESHCQCKLHVEGETCDHCLSGFFGLRTANSEGCLKCYCSGVSSKCESSQVEYRTYDTLEGWEVTDLAMSTFVRPTHDNKTGYLIFGMSEFPTNKSIYWMAPDLYCGNKLASYGAKFVLKLLWEYMRGDTSGKPTSGPDIIIIGTNGMKIGFGDNIYRTRSANISIRLTEEGWYHIPNSVKDIVTRLRRTDYRGDLVTRVQFMSVLTQIERILIRGTFHTDQFEGKLESAVLVTGNNDVDETALSTVEKCTCPIGYTGLSCERCDFGYQKFWTNSTTHEKIVKCLPCNCNGHAETCDLDTNQCGECIHNTYGERCERCNIGYYGNAVIGSPNDCFRCACPLLENSNNFSPSCQLKQLSLPKNQGDTIKINNSSAEYVCTQCPEGYIGDHCEICDYGYFGKPTRQGSKCLPCPCNGERCDSETGNCIKCLGNTEGWRCERCKSGYYGNPEFGCVECSCHKNGSLTDICDPVTGQCVCKSKFIGARCDNCDTGFANITLDCAPCECNQNGSLELHCDPNTGQCYCKSGVDGLKCDKCADEYFGFTSEGCQAASFLVASFGAGSSEFLALRTKRSTINDIIEDNLMDYDEYDIEFINYNRNSSSNYSNNSDSVELPNLQPKNIFNDSNLNLDDLIYDNLTNFYERNLNSKRQVKYRANQGRQSKNSRQWITIREPGVYIRPRPRKVCKCDYYGTANRICNPYSGICSCFANVVGSQCDRCKDGYWNIKSRTGCISCECNNDGSKHHVCHPYSGECTCKHGVGGKSCDKCLDGFYGFSSHGCKKCDECPNKSYICDPNTGRCMCPPKTKGPDCQQCLPNTWGWEYLKGCIDCECNHIGTIGQSCDLLSGQCNCRQGFTGKNCDRCLAGYYGYPDCRRCNCNNSGSRPEYITTGGITCDETGQCPCKTNVRGQLCDQCLETTFGLSFNNVDGCLPCFCFGRSAKCHGSQFSWGQIRSKSVRRVNIEFVSTVTDTKSDYSYVVIVQMSGNNGPISEDSEIIKMNDLNVIPKSNGNVTIGAYGPLYAPLYLQLSSQFSGDLINSYGGYLNFTIDHNGCDVRFPDNILDIYPLIQIHSHLDLIIDYYGDEMFDLGQNVTYKIKMHEKNWKYHYNGQNVTRPVMITALQNVQNIFVRASPWSDFTQVVLSIVTLDMGISISGTTNNFAVEIEVCDCDPRYSGTSCQNPNNGYYRYKNGTQDDINRYDDFIGVAAPCNCSGRSETCDRETGRCLNCRENTGGHQCNECAEGYFGDPVYGICEACPCPETRKNFARGCRMFGDVVNCVCKPEYTGKRCEQCLSGYFGRPDLDDGKCEPCDCNPDGILRSGCHETTGQCFCKPGIIGRRCDSCMQSKHVLEDRHCKLCDTCSLLLLGRVEKLNQYLVEGEAHINSIDITAPWEILVEFENDMHKLNKSLLHQRYIENELNNHFDETDYEKLYSNAVNLKNKRNKFVNNKIEKRKLEITKNLNDMETTQNEVKILLAQIKETVKILNEYGDHVRHISNKNAFNEARNKYEDLKIWRDKYDKLYNSSMTKISCSTNWNGFLKKFHLQLEDLAKSNKQIRTNLKEFEDKILELKAYASNTITDIVLNSRLVTDNDIRYRALVDKFQQIKNSSEMIDKYLKHNLYPKINFLLTEIRELLNGLYKKKIQIDDLTMELQLELVENHAELAKLKSIIEKAQNHSEHLVTKSYRYSMLFKKTQIGAEEALRASEAHSNIIKSINEAHMAADHAVNASLSSKEKIYSGPISLATRGEKSLNESQKIIALAEKGQQNINELKVTLKGHKDKIDTLKETIWQTGLTNNNITAVLNSNNLDDANKNVYVAAAKGANEIHSDMKTLTGDVGAIRKDILKLKERFVDLEPDWDTKQSMASENVTEARRAILRSGTAIEQFERFANQDTERFNKANSTIARRLQELEDKIARARHAAESIRISIDSSATGFCKRTYKPPSYGLKASTIIKMSIASKSDIENSTIIYIQGDDDRFMALEMVHRSIRLIWNLGGSTKSITHPLKIQYNALTNHDAWYFIEANRTMNLGTLNVRQMTQTGQLADSTSVTGASSWDKTFLFISSNSRIILGGINETNINNNELSNIGLGVVIHQLQIDDRPIGLWNFEKSIGDCAGAIVGPQETSAGLNSRFFNGEGYARISRTLRKPYKKVSFDIQMTFKTLDENALIFLAVDEINNRSISLTLFQGRVVFRIDYGGESKLEINTTKKYNTGKWVSVEAARHFTSKGTTENGRVSVNEEEINGSPTSPINSNMLPDLSQENFYLGGVPPGFKSGTTKAPGADNAFLGCMRDIQINGDITDPLESRSFFGIEPVCRETIRKAGFYGNGYIELPSYSLKQRGNFGFTFRSLQDNTLLLYATVPPNLTSYFDPKETPGEYFVGLLDGKITVWMSTGRSNIVLETNRTFNDGEYHVVNINKFQRKIDLRVDDENYGTKNFTNQPYKIIVPEDYGGLYLGGTPNITEFQSKVPTLTPLSGMIGDLVFNNHTVSFHNSINFTNVQMGRSGPKMGSLNGNDGLGKSFKQAAEGCQRVGSYSYEPNAFKYGDGNRSYSIINIPKLKFWQHNFLIEFDFRTFYPNGVIFVTPSFAGKNKHFLTLILKDGNVVLSFRDKRKLEIKQQNKLNDGHWHHVVIKCQNRATSITVDSIKGRNNQKHQQIKLPKRINLINFIAIGSLPPDNRSTLPKQLIKLEEYEFKGCIRKFKINNATQDLAKPDLHRNIGQCFPRIEKGSYFPGDAYAIYSRNFDIGKHLEFELEFKTSELNGVLVSVTDVQTTWSGINGGGAASLTLEMNNGNIIFSCHLGNGHPFSMQTNLPSKFSLCNNKWHTVSGLYDLEQIALRIDNEPYIVGLAQHKVPNMVRTNSPLYIGGLPETAPHGILKTRENFKGCIKNIRFENKIKDWTDMDELHNVLLSECLSVS